MSFKTTLFQALHVADFVNCNGHKVVSKLLDTSPQALLRPYVDLADDTTIYIEDVEILVDDEGRAYGVASAERPEPLVWTFHGVRPLATSDVPTIEKPTTVVNHVVDRLRRLNHGEKRRA